MALMYHLALACVVLPFANGFHNLSPHVQTSMRQGSSCPIVMSNPRPLSTRSVSLPLFRPDTQAARLKSAAAALAVATLVLAGPGIAFADGSTSTFKLPPIDRSDKNRCKFSSSAMGQANAARDSLYDLRECSMVGADASGFDVSGAYMAGGDFTGGKFVETQLSKVYANGATFDKADFTNGVVDRVSFKGASMRGVVFQNAVLSGTSFEGADLEDADFTEAYLGTFDQRALCKNPTLKGENPVTGAPTAESAGCSSTATAVFKKR